MWLILIRKAKFDWLRWKSGGGWPKLVPVLEQLGYEAQFEAITAMQSIQFNA